jgi:DNA-binding SARP family transcriptional activator/Cdc6-like AAA superfamily ATPase
MAQLELSLLGAFQVTLDGHPITGFKSNKVRALLAYLVVESDRPHRRERLAGLLWPDWPDRDALSNLRYALSDLRGAIGDREADIPYLLISRDSIHFNHSSDYRLDVKAFIEGIEADKSSSTYFEKLEEAVNLYQGSFLEGFSLEDSPIFEEWALLNRERLARQASSTLHVLAEYFEQHENYEKARSLVWRQLELEPWNETAHQRLMRILALSGQRSAALAQYESCRTLLAEELKVEPSDETNALYERIRTGQLKDKASLQSVSGESAFSPPAFLKDKSSTVETPVFVARTRELSRLNEHLASAIAGKGIVVFVTGEAGSGKTSLLQEFMRQAQEMYPDLLVAIGNCNAYTGIGDPYLPFREILEFLTGDVESRWAAGAITREHALRLWENVPIAAQALVEVGPDLIDSFIQRASILERATSRVSEEQDWLIRLGALLDRKPVTALSFSAIQHVSLFEQYTKVIQSVEAQSPILLLIDDLQWADTGSINLLFHLGRRLAGSRILILGAYRSEEVALGREGMRHPLEPVINEFRSSFGDILVNLGQALGQEESREFVDEFLDKEPNRLDESFREMLYQQTQGHPLFTIELLRGLQERGDIIKDHKGYWVTGPSLDWVTLPVRVEAAIQERISRLSKTMQKALEIASVEGELFTAEAVARVQEFDEREILGYFSGELNRVHRLVRAQSIQRVNNRLLSRYQFRHILFQKYLYGSLDEVLRVHLHEQVGLALEDLHGAEEGAASVAVQLALHFQIARVDEKAVHYLHLASDKAMQLSAYHEVIAHASRALDLLENIPESTGRDEQELALCLTLAFGLSGAKGGQLSEVRSTYDRARQLCEKMGKKFELVQVLGGLAIFYYVCAQHHKAQELSLEALDLATEINDPFLMMLCHWYLGFILLCLGEYPESLRHLRQVTEVYDYEKHHQIFLQVRGSDAGIGAMAYESCCLWCLGYPEQAQKRSQETLEIGRKLNHPFSLADAICFGGCLLNSMSRDAEKLAQAANALIETTDKGSLAGWRPIGVHYRGEALVLQGKIREGVELIRKGITKMKSEGISIYFSSTFATLAEKQLELSLLGDAHTSLDEAFAFIEETDERFWEAELFRLKGELLFADGEISVAEACLHKAIEIARKQSAKSLELRAVISLSRLWRKRGKKAKAKKCLEEIYNWFTEGFDTPDLIAAKKLLEELS